MLTKKISVLILVVALLNLNGVSAIMGEGKYVVKPSFTQIIDYPFFSYYDILIQQAKGMVALCSNSKYDELDKCVNAVMAAYNKEAKFNWNKEKCPEEKEEVSPYYALLQAYEDCSKTATLLPCMCGSISPEGLGDFKIKLEQPTEDTIIGLFNKNDEAASKLIPDTRLSTFELGAQVSDITKLQFEIKKDTCPDSDYCTADKKIELAKIGDRIALVQQKNSRKLPPLPMCNQPNIFVDVIPFDNKDYESEDKSTLFIGQSLKEKFSNNKINVELSFDKDTTGDSEIRKLVAQSALENSKAYLTLAISENIQEDFVINYNDRASSLSYLIMGKINKTFAEKNYAFRVEEILSSDPTHSVISGLGALSKPIPVIILTINKNLVNKYDEEYAAKLSDSIAEAINYYFLNVEAKNQRFKFCVQSKEEFYSYNSVTQAIEKKPLEFKFALTIGKKYKFPSEIDVNASNRIIEIAKDLGIPEDLYVFAIAIAYTESGLKHFDENGGVKVSPSMDHGIMQINENAHPDCFDNADSSDGICANKYCSGKTALDMDCNIAAGLTLINDKYEGKDKCETLSCCGELTSCALTREYCGVDLVARKYNGWACCPSQADPLDCGGYVATIKDTIKFLQSQT